jgi:hypothetical protein
VTGERIFAAGDNRARPPIPSIGGGERTCIAEYRQRLKEDAERYEAYLLQQRMRIQEEETGEEVN